MAGQDQFKERTNESGTELDPAASDPGNRWGDDTQELYASRGIGSRIGFGRHPALLVVDMAVAFCDPEHRLGAEQTSTVEAIARLLAATRAREVPSFFFTTAYHPDGRDGGAFARKIPALLDLVLGDPGVEIDPRIAPQGNEMVITKKFASAFFQTNLPSLLVNEGVDTIVLTGCSTSGCIRAAAIDAVSHGYRVIVPQECVSDRAEGPHRANLFDINAKYGDVMPLDEVIEQVDALAADPSERRVAAATGR